jgi:hypothetical protein
MAVNTAQGSKLYIGSEDANDSVDTQAEYEAQSWTEIGEVEDIGEFGDQWNTTEFAALADGRVRRFKTTKDAGTLNLVVGFSSGNAGQAAVKAAFASKNNYTVKITLNDAGTGSPSSPTTFYFRAQVLGDRLVVGKNDNVVRKNIPLAINSDLIEVAAV